MRHKQKKLRKVTKFEQYAMITWGIILMVAGFYYFIIPSDLVTGGVTGLGLVINELFDVQISYIVLAFNMCLLLVGLLFLGKKVFLRSIYGSVIFPIFLFLFESFAPTLEMEKDFVIAATFGGLLLGLGFGYVIKYGGTSGGTDIPIKILNRKLKLPLSVSIYLIDGIVILLGVIVFYDQYGIVTGLYAILSMFISGKVADMVVVGSNANKAVQIITDNPKEIKDSIFEYLERGVTELKIYGGYTKIEKTMLITVITRNEYYSLRNIIAEVDPKAFVYVTSATEIQGDFIVSEGNYDE
ncbi:hypothetical protein CI105_02050 [Candidatus Izimaplasma bacterium ZiA1]|uniref:YitT family protein n=1 Tax=Candidatus Izimoplasma sp. ZiA1 TaxID=2024899 RepID=UPI000BAA6965|nr:hypothetical protein CI105_02050 [Candidatus Izimaplasma bacterium ZiA1]